VNNDFEAIAWVQAHNWCTEAMITHLSTMKTIDYFAHYCPDPVVWLNQFYAVMQKLVSQDIFRSASILPNQLGTFRNLTALWHDRVHSVFKSAVFEEQGLKLRQELLDPRITSIELGRSKTLEDVGAFIKGRFLSPTAEVSPPPSKTPIIGNRRGVGGYVPQPFQFAHTMVIQAPPWSFVLQLIHILPSQQSENYKWNEMLLEAARTLFPGDIGSMTKTILDEDLPAAWNKPISICTDKIFEQLKRIGSVQALLKYCKNPVEWLNQFYGFMQNRLSAEVFDAPEIIPNQKGQFKRRKELFADHIPDVFKTPEFENQGLELRSVMLYPGITTIKLERKKTLRDIGDFVEKQYLKSSEQRWLFELTFARTVPERSPQDLWKLTLMLIHILPFDQSPNYGRNELLLTLITKLFPQEIESFSIRKTVLEEDLPYAWEKPLISSVKKLISSIEGMREVSRFPSLLGEPFEFLIRVFEVLKLFKIADTAQLYPNQKGPLCKLENLNDDSDLTEELKDALLELPPGGQDLRVKLLDRRIRAVIERSIPCMPVKEVCSQIDSAVKTVHKDRALYENSVFRRHITYIYARWIRAGEEKAALFPYFDSQKASIMSEIILDKDMRELLMTFATWEPSRIHAVIAQEENAASLESQREVLDNQRKLQEEQERALERRQKEVEEQERKLKEEQEAQKEQSSVLEEERRRLREEELRFKNHQESIENDRISQESECRSLLTKCETLEGEVARLMKENAALRAGKEWGTTAIQTRIESKTTTVHREVTAYVRHTFSQFLPRSTNYDHFSSYVEDLTAKEEVGYLGEAAVFKDLRDSGKFSRVHWLNQTTTRTGQRVEMGGEVFFVSESGQSYDIEVVTFHSILIYIEVKSSCRDRTDGRACHYFGSRQLELFSSASERRLSVLALVFNARCARPGILYLKVGPFLERQGLA
jgi:hypothetical protein